jgi:hypothetical protein
VNEIEPWGNTTKRWRNFSPERPMPIFAFADLVSLLTAKGYLIRQGAGSHVILQADGSKAKGYQVRQVRNVFLNHPDLLR